MTPLFKKLNFKNQDQAVILNAPGTFNAEIQAMLVFARVETRPGDAGDADFVLAFALTQAEVDAFAVVFSEKTSGDAVLWIAYPKGSSKRYKCDFNRDTGWEVLGKLGFEPVRQVAIDEDWSALRFRRVEFIREMTRGFVMTEAGKAKAPPLRCLKCRPIWRRRCARLPRRWRFLNNWRLRTGRNISGG